MGCRMEWLSGFSLWRGPWCSVCTSLHSVRPPAWFLEAPAHATVSSDHLQLILTLKTRRSPLLCPLLHCATNSSSHHSQLAAFPQTEGVLRCSRVACLTTFLSFPPYPLAPLLSIPQSLACHDLQQNWPLPALWSHVTLMALNWILFTLYHNYLLVYAPCWKASAFRSRAVFCFYTYIYIVYLLLGSE